MEKHQQVVIPLLTIGSPMLVVTSTVNEDFLQKYNLNKNDAILANEEIVNLFNELTNCHYSAGGTTINTARIVQWISRKPKIVKVIGAIGEDHEGETLFEELRASNVDSILQKYKDAPTAKCAALIYDNNRSLVTTLGASALLNFDSLLWECVERARIIYLPAFILNISEKNTLKIAKCCAGNSTKFVFNVGATFLCRKYPETFKEILEYVDILFGNEDEMKCLGRLYNLSREENEDEETFIKRLNVKLSNLPKRDCQDPRLVITTRGADNVIYSDGYKAMSHAVPKINNEDIGDTNAAGDAFVGGFLAKLIESVPVEDCLKCAVWASQEVIKNTGCHFDHSASFSD